MAVKLEKLPNNVYLLTLTGDGEHRFTPSSIPEIVAALDEVEKDPQAAALVTTGEGRFYSNGLSLSLVNKTSRENLVSSFHGIHHPTLFSILDSKFCL
jgi:enoyl-CoA hydratase/carnithine racemase